MAHGHETAETEWCVSVRQVLAWHGVASPGWVRRDKGANGSGDEINGEGINGVGPACEWFGNVRQDQARPDMARAPMAQRKWKTTEADATWLGWARCGMAVSGGAGHGMACQGSQWLKTARMKQWDSAWPGGALLGALRLDSAWQGVARCGKVRMGEARAPMAHGINGNGMARPGKASRG